MAGEWIKVRTNLWDDPRVSQIVEMTDTQEATVIGGLYWLWSTADEHTESGIMPGMSANGIDRKTGVKGLGAALIAVGWVEVIEGGIAIVRFSEHNGASAKQRAQTAKRVSKCKGNAPSVSEALAEGYPAVSDALPREDKIRDKEEDKKPESKSKASATGSRLPEDWKPSAEDVEYCKTERPDLRPSAVAQNFYDYWIAKPGKDGRKLDWSATWRSWVRKESAERAGRGVGKPAGRTSINDLGENGREFVDLFKSSP